MPGRGQQRTRPGARPTSADRLGQRCLRQLGGLPVRGADSRCACVTSGRGRALASGGIQAEVDDLEPGATGEVTHQTGRGTRDGATFGPQASPVLIDYRACHPPRSTPLARLPGGPRTC